VSRGVVTGALARVVACVAAADSSVEHGAREEPSSSLREEDLEQQARGHEESSLEDNATTAVRVGCKSSRCPVVT